VILYYRRFQGGDNRTPSGALSLIIGGLKAAIISDSDIQ
jgi:hypothetical protein